MKRVGFFKNAYFDRRTTQSEFCFETNILCNRRVEVVEDNEVRSEEDSTSKQAHVKWL